MYLFFMSVCTGCRVTEYCHIKCRPDFLNYAIITSYVKYFATEDKILNVLNGIVPVTAVTHSLDY
jgi:hypothetical protein